MKIKLNGLFEEIIESRNEAIETVLSELDRLKKYEDLEWQEFNELAVANAELKKKDSIINLMALAILNYDDQLVINKYKDINDVKETFEEILKEKLYD